MNESYKELRKGVIFRNFEKSSSLQFYSILKKTKPCIINCHKILWAVENTQEMLVMFHDNRIHGLTFFTCYMRNFVQPLNNEDTFDRVQGHHSSQGSYYRFKSYRRCKNAPSCSCSWFETTFVIVSAWSDYFILLLDLFVSCQFKFNLCFAVTRILFSFSSSGFFYCK